MSSGLSKGSYAHVTGTFDLTGQTGTIDYVTPVRIATLSPPGKDEGVHLIGEDSSKNTLFDQVAKLQRNSCAPNASQGTYENYIPVTPELHSVRLEVRGANAANFARGQKSAPRALSFGDRLFR